MQFDQKRREFITLLGSAAASWPLAARAQQPGRVWRIGILETTSIALNAANFEAFRQSLRDLGYIEEQNLIIEYRSAEGRGERFTDLAADLLSLEHRRDRNTRNACGSGSEKSHDDDTHCHGSNG
jgi:hypothetical protein